MRLRAMEGQQKGLHPLAGRDNRHYLGVKLFGESESSDSSAGQVERFKKVSKKNARHILAT
jgi:hypothetical protein